MDIIAKLFKNLWLNTFIMLLLVIAIVNCIIRYRKGLIAYKYYTNFMTGLLIIWIIQIFQRSVPPHSIYGLLIGLFIGIIFIFSLFNFYKGFKKEKTK
jgi:hypothetical protein